jgi:tetratricopeptide (TPR) repeat protein
MKRYQCLCCFCIKCLTCLVLVFSSAQAFSHDDLSHQIEDLDKKIEGKEFDSVSIEFQLKRARLKNLEHLYDEAIEDCLRVLSMDKHNANAHFLLASAYLNLQKNSLAETHALEFQQSVTSVAAQVRAHALLGGIYEGAQRWELAFKHYHALLVQKKQPSPNDFLRTAKVAGKIPNNDQQALKTLEQGISSLGNLSVLQESALALELEAGLYSNALNRIEHILSSARGLRYALLLEKKAKVYTLMGELNLAELSVASALESLQKLPLSKQNSEPAQELFDRLKASDI